MTVSINSIVQTDDHFRARARAVAQDAVIMIEIRFLSDRRAEVWRDARAAVLRYLDIA